MKICLISALSMDEDDTVELAGKSNRISAPLGVLSLAAVLCEKGITPHIVNLDKTFLDFIGCKEEGMPPDLLTYFFQEVNSLHFDIIGMSTVCNSYPLTIIIAQEIKKSHPDIQIILGGPQASTVDIPTMKAFPFIDFVVRGEAEHTFPLLIEALSRIDSSQEIEKIPGVTFRKGAEIIRNPNAPPISDIDDLPMPAYHLDPNINSYTNIPIEAGRGCPFRCTFCSTSGFFNRKFRIKSPDNLIQIMRYIRDKYDVNDITFHHDNFTLNRRKLIEFCESLIKCGDDFDWTCSSRADQLDDELIALMIKAGCKGVFFGIETGSVRLQQLIKKNIDPLEAVEQIQSASKQGLPVDISLIIGFPEETRDDLKDTINFFVDMLRFSNVEPQLSLLAPLAGTQIYSMHKNELVLDYIFSDVSFQGTKMNPKTLELIRDYPEVFPNFYSVPTSFMDRKYLKEVHDFFTYMHSRLLWLPLALLVDSGDMLKVFDSWRLWLRNKFIDSSDTNIGEESYYISKQFPQDLVEFVRDCYIAEMASAKQAISAIVDIESLFVSIAEGPAPESCCSTTAMSSLSSFPYKPKGLHIAKLSIDYRELIQCLRDKKNLKDVPAKNITIAFREGLDGKKDINVLLLSPLSEELLGICDGSRTISDIIHHSPPLTADVEGVPPEKIRFFGLTQLFKQGLIDISSEPIAIEENSSCTSSMAVVGCSTE